MDKYLHQRAKDIISARIEKERAKNLEEQNLERKETERWQQYVQAIKTSELRISEEEKIIKPIHKVILKLLHEIKDFAQKNKIHPESDNKISEYTSFDFDIIDRGFDYSPCRIPSSSKDEYSSKMERGYYSGYHSSEGEDREKVRIEKLEKLINEIQSIHPAITLILRWGSSRTNYVYDSDGDSTERIILYGIRVEINHDGKILINNQTYETKGDWKSEIRFALSDAFYSPIALGEENKRYLGHSPEPKKRPLWHRIWYGNESGR